jgi:hypothetical protein
MTRAAGAHPTAGERMEHALAALFLGSYCFFSGFFGPSTGGSDLM